MSNDGTNFSPAGSRPLFGSDLLSGIVASVSDIALIVDRDGKIEAAMAGADSRSFGETSKWPGRSLADLVDPESYEKFLRRQEEVVRLAQGGDRGSFRWAELIHRGGDAPDYPVRYSIHWLEDRKRLLLLGRDQRPVIEIQQQLIGAQIALERDFEAQRKHDTRYRLLMDSTRDAFVLISMSTGKIVDINRHAATLLGLSRSESVGTSFPALVEGVAGSALLTMIATNASAETPRAIELRLARNQIEVLLSPKVFRAAGERLALCRLDEAGQGEAGGGRLGGFLSELFFRGPDAIVFTDRDGTIELASEAFLNLVDAEGIASVRGRSIADFLARGVVDLKLMLDNARRAGHLRVYSTRIKTDFDALVAVEISATWLNDRSDATLALVIRDISLQPRLRVDGSPVDEGGRAVTELVGSAPLKDIVAETANEVEKLCIQTAIELTRNNRVAAAEMLGLSRQSLYVKLRKYGMIARDEE